jgi:hypothetical protein
MALLPERCMTPDPVYRDPDDLGAEAMKFLVQLVIEAQLITAHRTPVGGIEDEDHQPAAKFLE